MTFGDGPTLLLYLFQRMDLLYVILMLNTNVRLQLPNLLKQTRILFCELRIYLLLCLIMPIFKLFIKQGTFDANYSGDYRADLLLEVTISTASASSSSSCRLSVIFTLLFRGIIKSIIILTNGI